MKHERHYGWHWGRVQQSEPIAKLIGEMGFHGILLFSKLATRVATSHGPVAAMRIDVAVERRRQGHRVRILGAHPGD